MESSNEMNTETDHEYRVARAVAALAELRAEEESRPQQLASEASNRSEAVTGALAALAAEEAQLADANIGADSAADDVASKLDAVDDAKRDLSRATRAYDSGEPYPGVVDARGRLEHLELDHQLAVSRKARADQVVVEASARVKAAQWAVDSARMAEARAEKARLTERAAQLVVELGETVDLLAEQITASGGDFFGARFECVESVSRAIVARGMRIDKVLSWVSR